MHSIQCTHISKRCARVIMKQLVCCIMKTANIFILFSYFVNKYSISEKVENISLEINSNKIDYSTVNFITSFCDRNLGERFTVVLHAVFSVVFDFRE